MIACPKCSAYMVPLRIRDVDLDCCSSCKGLWCDRGELAKLTGADQDLPADAPPSQPTTFPCSHCGSPLRKRPYSRQFSLHVEVCDECEGVFLDDGELRKIESMCSVLDATLTPLRQEKSAARARRAEALTAIYHTEEPAAKECTHERARFLRNVYLLLAGTLVVTAIGSAVGFVNNIGRTLFFPALIAEIILFLVALWLRRVAVVNLILLFAYTFLSGFTLSVVLMRYVETGYGEIIWQAAAMTGTIFAALSAYVHVTRKDFSWMGGMLFASLLILLVSGLFTLVLGVRLPILWSAFSAVVFCGYILYDTSNILLKFDTSEVVSAVLELYLDIINLFLDLLRILSYLRR